jgi:hypothetical protein
MANGNRRVLATGAVMFPIALGSGDVSGRQLDPDDIAGISRSVSGQPVRSGHGQRVRRVMKDGRGVFGAHVVAFDPGNGDLVGNFTLSTSGISIGLRPGRT